jgi:hypothetical protein
MALLATKEPLEDYGRLPDNFLLIIKTNRLNHLCADEIDLDAGVVETSNSRMWYTRLPFERNRSLQAMQ